MNYKTNKAHSQEIPIMDDFYSIYTVLSKFGYKIGYLRQDDDSHWYIIPSEKVDEFDELLDQMYESNELDYDIADEFDAKFGHYRTGGGIHDIKVLMEINNV